MTRKRILVSGLALSVTGVLFLIWLVQGPNINPRNLTGLEGDIRRGAYMARVSGCIGCHTDIKSGGAVLAGGAAIKTDFGSFYAPNITPDKTDGIGNWTLQQFADALTAGSGPSGEHLYPAFPYSFYNKLTDQDVVDLWSAIQSVPAVSGQAPEHDLAFPFSVRKLNGAWQRFFLDTAPIETSADETDGWNRGRYLAEGPAHCGACHTPRNLLGGLKLNEKLAGGIGPDGKRTPAITAQALTKNGWTRADLAYAFKTGLLPNGDSFGGAMAEIVQDSMRYWTHQDLEALAEFLMTSNQAN